MRHYSQALLVKKGNIDVKHDTKSCMPYAFHWRSISFKVSSRLFSSLCNYPWSDYPDVQTDLPVPIFYGILNILRYTQLDNKLSTRRCFIDSRQSIIGLRTVFNNWPYNRVVDASCMIKLWWSCWISVMRMSKERSLPLICPECVMCFTLSPWSCPLERVISTMKTLTTEELGKLFQVFSSDETLEVVDDEFNKCFIKSDHFRVGCSICILLQDQMLTKAQVWIYFSNETCFTLCNCYFNSEYPVAVNIQSSLIIKVIHVISSPANFGIFNTMWFVSRRVIGSEPFHALLSGFCRAEHWLMWKEVSSRAFMLCTI